MRQCFKRKRFSSEVLEQIDVCNRIIERYQEQDLVLTLRQLYYRIVATDQFPADRKWSKLPNTEKWVRDPAGTVNAEPNYKWLGGIVSDARLAGLIDWDAIEDRVRKPDLQTEFSSVEELVAAALQAYRLPRWDGQENYVELWVEKDALAGVLKPIARQWHVTLMVNRGYSSSSAMYESARRLMTACYDEPDEDSENYGDEPEYDVEGDVVPGTEPRVLIRQPVLLYIGDHDPSGEDMVRDIRSRLTLFGVEDLTVRKLALTMDQVRQYNPPPNPAKMSDSRAAAYVDKFGTSSWEVDALPPEVLRDIIGAAMRELVDEDKMEEIKVREVKDKDRLRKAAARIAKTCAD